MEGTGHWLALLLGEGQQDKYGHRKEQNLLELVHQQAV